LPGPSGPGVEGGKEFHPIPPVAITTCRSCAGPPGLEGENPGLVLVCSLSGLRGHNALRKSQVLDTMRSLRATTASHTLQKNARPTLLQLHTSCLPAIPAPEGRKYSCRGRQAPGPKEEKSSILSCRWLAPPAVTVSALRAWKEGIRVWFWCVHCRAFVVMTPYASHRSSTP